MKILSKVKDYYDGLMAYAPEEEPLFIREYKHLLMNELSLEVRELICEYTFLLPSVNGISIFFIFFCGKLYIRFMPHDYNEKSTLSYDEVVEYVKLHFSKRPRYYWRDPLTTLTTPTPGRWKSFADYVKPIPVKTELFRLLNCPYFTVIKGNDEERFDYSVHIHPKLEDVGFCKVMDPFTTFQEISMFIGNFLTDRDKTPTTVGSDEIIAQQKGFNKESFRAVSPGEAKARRKENRLKKRGLA